MPNFLKKPVSRRNFLQKSSLLMGSAVFFNPLKSSGNTRSTPDELHWAFLSDTHINEIDDSSQPPENLFYYNPQGNLRKAISQVLTASPQGVCITGDLARLEGKTGDYQILRNILAPLSPEISTFLALGNHDNRENFLQVFNQEVKERQDLSKKFVLVIESTIVRLVLLDSLMFTNKTPGFLGKAQRNWLNRYLVNCDDTPTLLCVHHTLSDEDGDLLDVDRLIHIIRPLRKVKAIFYGHSHELHFDEFEGIHFINIPGMGYSFNENESVGWLEARLTSNGSELAFHPVAGKIGANLVTKSISWRQK